MVIKPRKLTKTHHDEAYDDVKRQQKEKQPPLSHTTTQKQVEFNIHVSLSGAQF